ncbi:MAG: hypothetical protein R3282_06305 [Rhodothermales bacterium]|nr:hypothetical protein [Rhodothermales bacterium]
MDYSVYKLLHYLGIALLLVAVGGICVHAANTEDKRANVARKVLLSMHGVGTLFILVAGFGLLAKLGPGMGFPAWVWPKLIIWVLLAASIALPYRNRKIAIWIAVAAPVLVLVSAYFALYKPF